MNNALLQTTLKELNIPIFIQQADHATLARMIASVQTEDTSQPAPEKLSRYGFIYEKQGIRAYQNLVAKQDDEKVKETIEYFQKAFTCWRTLASLPDDSQKPLNEHISTIGIQLVETEFRDELLPAQLTLAFRLGVSGLLAECTAETRLELKKFHFPLQENFQENWRSVVSQHIFSAFVLLVRKDKGWEDIFQALSSIKTLRQIQYDYEEKYLERIGEPEKQTLAALELVGFYHLAQLITLVGEYLLTGELGSDKVNLRLDRHHEQSVEAFEVGEQPLLAHLGHLLWAGCRELVQNAIWTHVSHLGEGIQNYVQVLTATAREQPVIELWPSQQEAFHRHLLDPYQRAILVEMPTSAGKTLLAKFAIIQTKALNPNAIIAYIVPTRALVNQITIDFRMDFGQIMQVEQTVSAFELDPTEEQLLKNHIDILVTTPEKLDLLIRSEHPVTKNIALVVADEAHNIGEGDRGARLELLLGTLKRDRARARFLLLSPFLPNGQELVQWLGEDQALPPISIKWKPSRKLVGSVQTVKSKNEWILEFETLPSAHAKDIRPFMKINIGQTSNRITSLESLTASTVQSLLKRGSILVLCHGSGTSVTRAKQIAESMDQVEPSETLEAVCHYLEAELGKDCDLVRCLRHGVAFHHAGLSHEARWLIEGLIRERLVNVVCGTTTLAQGINFPITTVIIETLRKGKTGELSFQDFWNIAGRAGRTLIDTIGTIIFPAPTKEKREKYIKFLENDAKEIASQLAKLIERADEIVKKFDLQTLRENSQLSPLLQFLAHAMRVSGNGNLANEVEELLRSSLVYHQVQKQSQDAAQKLIKICRSYLEQTRKHQNILDFADKTGFATPSVLEILSRKEHSDEIALAMNWRASRIFGDNLNPLRERIEAIADLPEIKLGQEEGYPFNAKRVALILRDWVNGKTLEEMAQKYGKSSLAPNKQVVEFSKYLFSMLGTVSWGIGALETVCLASNEQVYGGDIGYIPSMIFFGVRQKEAIWLRMAGVPRIVANGLAGVWKRRIANEPKSYHAIREWVADLSDSDWQQVIPPGTSLTPKDMRLIWQDFSGETNKAKN